MRHLVPAHPGPACARVLDDESQALAGYPVNELVQAWLTACPESGDFMDRRAGAIFMNLLRRWTGELSQQQAAMTQRGTVSLEQIYQRTQASHRALLRLLALVEQVMFSGAEESLQSTCSKSAVDAGAFGMGSAMQARLLASNRTDVASVVR